MKKIVTFIFLFYHLVSFAFGQSADSLVIIEPKPVGGVNSLIYHFYDINFEREQRQLLNDVEVELIFNIDREGNPELKVVNGVADKAIRDSLFHAAKGSPQFIPYSKNGIPEETTYFLMLTFPSFDPNSYEEVPYLQSIAFKEANYEDFEYLEKGQPSLDILISGQMNQFLGSPANHLGLGGGMKLDMFLTTKKYFTLGLDMSFYGNKLKSPFDLDINESQNQAPPSLFVGIIIGKQWKQITTNLEANVMVINITPSSEHKETGVQFNGWSPGLTLHYPIKIGKPIPRFEYSRLGVYQNNIDLNIGIKQLLLDNKQASGTMVELGVGYRINASKVKKYKLKENWKN
ncbi:hypothetical protein [uncultured Arcticibacterium sp.]|uniref:hypothetical protein n=1 Tax=uncultured Arcticibacterium sp. TaxID=2173042 RepID=UPI0030F75C33